MQFLAAGLWRWRARTRKALAVAADLARKRPDDTLVQTVSVPVVQAPAALSAGDGAKAIEILKVGRAL